MFKYGTLRLFFTKIFIGTIFIAFSLMLFLSLISFNPEDPGFKNFAYHQNIHNYLGYFGAKLSSFMLVFWGHASYIISLFFFSKGFKLVLGIGSIRFFVKCTDREYWELLLLRRQWAAESPLAVWGCTNQIVGKFCIPLLF